jgi:PAS domain S-box-containing protein
MWTYLGAIVAVSMLYLGGALDAPESGLMDFRFHMVQRPATGTLVLVDMDARSMQELRDWPWPRGYYAQILQNLESAGAAMIALDVDLSSPGKNDAELAATLSDTKNPLIMAAFQQGLPAAGGAIQQVYTHPLPAFARSTRVATVNVRPDSGGLIRRFEVSQRWRDGRIVSMAAALAGRGANSEETFYLDYGIDLEFVPRISFIDVLNRDFDSDLVANKNIIIGATAIELGDIISVPIYRTLAGPLLQVLAYESLVQGRTIQRFGGLLLVACLLLLAPFFAGWLERHDWRKGLAGTLVLIIAGFGATILVQFYFPVSVDFVPIAIVIALCYCIFVIRQIKRLNLRVLLRNLMIRRKDALVQGVIQHGFDAIITVDAEGAIQLFNPAAERIFGYDSIEVLDTAASRIFAKSAGIDNNDPNSWYEAFSTPTETVGRRKNGEEFPISIVVSRMPLDAQDNFVVVTRDITENKLAEAELNRAQDQLREAVASIPEGFTLFDAEDRFVLCNERYRELYPDITDLLKPGWSRSDIFHALAGLGLTPEAAEDPVAWVAEQIAKSRQSNYEEEVKYVDGSWIKINERRTPDGSVVGIHSDITEAKLREEDLMAAKIQAESSNRTKSQFLAMMSHELRTPLNAVLGFSDIMRQEMLGPIENKQYIDYLNDIHGGANHLLEIINDILDIAKVETAEMVLDEQVLSIRDIVDFCERASASRAEKGDIVLTIDVPENLPKIRADITKSRQLVLNLMSNALKFTPAGGSVTVTAGKLQGGGLEICVIDTGIGIAEADIARALEPFGQIDSELSRKYEGTGLGLPLVKALMELHGGEFLIDSENGVGTTVSVRFPASRTVEQTETTAVEGSALAANR